MDIIFDYNDYIRVVWNAVIVDDDGVHCATYLFHYGEQTGEINRIAINPISDDWHDIGGSWNLPICKMNMGIHDTPGAQDGVFVTWTQFDTSDVSSGGYGNGELFMSYSIDNGLTWTEPQNLTNSPTPDCLPGDCDSDNWSSLADVVDDSLHLIYIDDKCPAASERNEGVPTENPVMYLAMANPLATGMKNHKPLPASFSLNQNYPNPFNVSTTIPFSVKQAGPVKLEIFDITGALVETLVNAQMQAGEHCVTWDANELASGTYLYKLTDAKKSSVRKAVLVK